MSKRLDKIKAARNINEILDVISDIAYEFKNSSTVVNKLVASLSATLVMDVRNKTPKTIDIDFKPPKVTELKKHVDVVNKLYDNVVELDAAEAMVKQSFAGNKKQAAALASIRDLKRSIDDSINDAFDALGAIATKHVPSKFAKLTDAITGHLLDCLPSTAYKDIFRQLYVVPDPTEAGFFHFCEYIGIEGLKNTQGFQYAAYYVVVTGIVEKTGALKFHVNGLPDFKVPGRYPVGREVLDLNGAKRHVDMLMDHNNFVVELERRPMPIDGDRATTAGFTSLPGVDSVQVVDDALIAVLKPGLSDAQVEKTNIEIRARLSSIVGRKSGTLFQSKKVRNGTKEALKFILVPDIGKKLNISLQRLEEVSELMGLSDNQKSALRFALQN